jgi:hypothetical protein
MLGAMSKTMEFGDFNGLGASLGAEFNDALPGIDFFFFYPIQF